MHIDNWETSAIHQVLFKVIRIGVVLVAFQGALATHAAVTTTATLSNITWTLQNLHPDDSIPPSLLITTNGGNQAGANHYSTLFETHSSGGNGTIGDASATANLVAGQTASATVTTGVAGQLPLLALSAQGSTVASAPAHFARFDAAATSWGWAFVLSPHTQVIFSASSSLHAEMTGGGAEASFGHTALWVALQPGEGVPSAVEDMAFVSMVTPSAPGRQSSLGNVSVRFDNASGDSVTAYLSATANAYGETLAPPVPEPAGWAMLLAGLGVIGAWGLPSSRRMQAVLRP